MDGHLVPFQPEFQLEIVPSNCKILPTAFQLASNRVVLLPPYTPWPVGTGPRLLEGGAPFQQPIRKLMPPPVGDEIGFTLPSG